MSLKKLTILGCSSQQPTRLRNQGAYLLQWLGQGFLIDPGEGTQRQFIFANVRPTVVTHILISHFHGDHCLGLGSMLMRLNLDRVPHTVHCYYPASGALYFKRLRRGTIYHQHINIVEHPIEESGVVEETERFILEAYFLHHGVDNLGWRIVEKEQLRFDKDALQKAGIKGLNVKKIAEEGAIRLGDQQIQLDQVSFIQKGQVFASLIDTKVCPAAALVAKDATMLLCESTYLEEHAHLAEKHKHLTAKQAAQIAKEGGVEKLILTHYSARYRSLEPFKEEAREIFPNVDVADDFKNFSFPGNR